MEIVEDSGGAEVDSERPIAVLLEGCGKRWRRSAEGDVCQRRDTVMPNSLHDVVR
jgi:hypothetical protein